MKIFKYILFSLIITINVQLQAQVIPTDIQEKLEEIKSDIKKKLHNYRIDDDSKIWPWRLSSYFHYEQRNKVNELGLKLSYKMVFDEAMINRMILLLNNKYEEYEIDTLLNRHSQSVVKYSKTSILEKYHFDTLSSFKKKYDSIYPIWERERSESWDGEYKQRLLDILRVDTSEKYLKILEIELKKEEKEQKQRIINEEKYYLDIITVCGLINDTCFIKPLIEILKKNNSPKNLIEKTLARMGVEPYTSTFFKKYQYSIDRIRKGGLSNIDIFELVDVLRTQESFLELSKWLYSNEPCVVEEGNIVIERIGECVFDFIKMNLENEELKEMLKERNHDNYKKERDFLFNWMQKNRGKYKIRRVW